MSISKKYEKLPKNQLKEFKKELRSDVGYLFKGYEEWTIELVKHNWELMFESEIDDEEATGLWFYCSSSKRNDRIRHQRLKSIVGFNYIEEPHKTLIEMYLERLEGKTYNELLSFVKLSDPRIIRLFEPVFCTKSLVIRINDFDYSNSLKP